MKKFIAILLTLSVLICLCACGAKKAETAAEENPSTKPETEAEEPAKAEETPESSDVLPVSGAEISFAFCNVAPPDHPQNVAYREIAEEISELSGGKITMNIYDNAQMGGIIETMHGTIDGTIEMVVVSMPTICSFDYGLMVNDLPYLWPSVEVACSILNDDSNGIAAAEMANLESKGAHFLGVANNGPMIVANSKREIASPADMAGLKIRTPEAATEQAFMEACGAIPTIMASTEVYTSLQTKVVDGHDFDPIITMSGGYDEVTSYITETNHILKLNGFFVNSAWWNSLDPMDQAFLEAEFDKMFALSDEYCAEATTNSLSDMEAAGIVVTELTDEQRAEFEEIGRGIWEQFYDQIDTDLLQKIQDEIAKYE